MLQTNPALLIRGECLAAMAELPPRSIDLVLCDLPYGTTEASWDSVIPFGPLWAAYARVLKADGTVVLTCQQPFTTRLIASNYAWYRYSWTWVKNRTTGYANAKRRPLKATEDVAVFSPKPPRYNAQGLVRLGKPRVAKTAQGGCETMPGRGFRAGHEQHWTNYPKNLLPFSSDRGGVHPTQKPVALMDYMIRTYTDAGDVVLDNTMGSGTTGVAAVRAGRRFVGMEDHDPYFDHADRRIAAAIAETQADDAPATIPIRGRSPASRTSAA